MTITYCSQCGRPYGTTVADAKADLEALIALANRVIAEADRTMAETDRVIAEAEAELAQHKVKP